MMRNKKRSFPVEGDRVNGKVFISDLHGQKDVLDYLATQDFGLIRKLTTTICSERYRSSVQECVERLLVNARINIDKRIDQCPREPVTPEVIGALLEILVIFKNERSFWLGCIKHLTNCGWMLAKIDTLTMGEPLGDHFLYEISSFEDFDRAALASYIARVIIELIQYRINVVGDIYDRGSDAYSVMEFLSAKDNVHIQWGNHDVLWLGAAAGSLACIATVVRICLRYGALDTLESDYGVDLSTLELLAKRQYATDDCDRFPVKNSEANEPHKRDNDVLKKMHKAVAIIQFKLEEQLLERNTHFQMEGRRLLNNVDFDAGYIRTGEVSISLEDTIFPTVDRESPAALSEEERVTIEALRDSFLKSERLTGHMDYLLANGGMYDVDGRYLLFHGCVPLDEKGNLMGLEMAGAQLTGRPLFNALELQLRKAYSRRQSTQCHYLSDIAWYLWCGPASPLFGKSKMTTFERYFIADKHYHKEGKNRYFVDRENPQFIDFLAEEFGCSDDCVIVNGHVPVKVSSGESPFKARGRMVCIDGGFAAPYRKVTGISGLTLVHSHGEAALYCVEAGDQGFELSEMSPPTVSSEWREVNG